MKWKSFRFIDERLQASLIEHIQNAGIAYKIAKDGAVLFSQDDLISIRQFIDRLVDIVFPDSFYRVAIADSKKADRYRRFKKFSGTPFIEEIDEGETYFVQRIYEKLYRNRGNPTHASFLLMGDNLAPDRVTELLGLSPTFACMKGEPFTRPYSGRRKDVPWRPSSTGFWEICSIPHLESNDINLHLEWIMRMLEPASSKLTNISEEIPGVDNRVLQIDIVISTKIFPGMSLSSPLLQQIGILCDRAEIRFWQDDFV